jgi:hypothetical protein
LVQDLAGVRQQSLAKSAKQRKIIAECVRRVRVRENVF